MRQTRHGEFALRAASGCVAGALAAFLVSCGGGGGGGYGGGGMSGSTNMACGGGYGGSVSCPAPTVTLTAPAPGATVSGTVTLTATASASSTYALTVTSVEFMIDAKAVGTAMSSPYSVMWNSTTVAKGSYSLTAKVTDSAGGTSTTPPIMINTTGMAAAAVAMTPAQLFPVPMSGASGMAEVTVEPETGAMHGKVKVAGMAATAVTLNEGFAGATGPTVVRLSPSAANATEWSVPAGALLTAEQLRSLAQGKLYVIAASAAHPRGEIRGQITPANVVVTFSAMALVRGAQGVAVGATGVIATTFDRSAHTLSIHVNSTGVEEADAAEVDSTGTGVAVLDKDSLDMGHWSTELTPVGAAEIANFEAGRWHATIATAVDAGGALRGQISAPGN